LIFDFKKLRVVGYWCAGEDFWDWWKINRCLVTGWLVSSRAELIFYWFRLWE
jgi:hypothetical protein